jgi:hypothetical protein
VEQVSRHDSEEADGEAQLNPGSQVSEWIEAHGGLDRWRSIEDLGLRISTGGLAFASKRQRKAIRGLEARVSTRSQRTVFFDYPAPGHLGIFERGAVHIETDSGDVVSERSESDARSADRSRGPGRGWDKLHVLYFAGYALWTYLNLPFLLAEPGFEVREVEPWGEGEETWRRVAVTFPTEIHTHSREQVLYFDNKGLLRRQDYTAEPFGDWARAAHYCFDHRSFEGLVFPTRRRVHPRRRSNRPLRPVTLVWIEIEGVRADPDS